MIERDKVAENINKARAELEQALENLERIPLLDPSTVAFTAHALSNYLNVTGGTVYLLQQALKNNPDQQVQKWLEGLQHVTTLMTHTVSQLMCTSITTASQLKFENIDMIPLVGRVCEFYRRIADRKQIGVQYIPPDNLPSVRADRVAVAAILDNLLSNAVKYSPRGKKVGIQLTSEPSGVACRVCDEGPGLTPTEQTKLFQRGVRLSPQPTGGEPTMGYGLSVAKELVNKMEGQIWYETNAGDGACFAFRLPRSTG